MKNKDMTFLQKLMEEMDSDQLNEMLQDELHKETPDGNAVRTALSVLESREKLHSPAFSEDTEDAWKKYQAKSKALRTAPTKRHNAVLKVASVVLIFGILFFAIPQTVQASGLFDRIVQWTDSLFELLTPEDDLNNHSEYVFKTDNPGLQQVYDAVVELGVIEPVVPMWLPGDYQLVRCDLINMIDLAVLATEFTDGEKKAVIQINVFSQNVPSSYHKDDRDVEYYEANGIEHSIIHNNARRVVIWVRDSIECVISLDCQEEELYTILKSIYSVEGQ